MSLKPSFIVYCFFLGACASSPKSSSESVNASPDTESTASTALMPGEFEISKDSFISGFKKVFPKEMCKDKSYFRECMVTTQDECLLIIGTATDTCIVKHEPDLPKTFVQPRDGGKWGHILGTCAGTNAELEWIRLGKKRTDNAKCNSADAWVK